MIQALSDDTIGNIPHTDGHNTPPFPDSEKAFPGCRRPYSQFPEFLLRQTAPALHRPGRTRFESGKAKALSVKHPQESWTRLRSEEFRRKHESEPVSGLPCKALHSIAGY